MTYFIGFEHIVIGLIMTGCGEDGEKQRILLGLNFSSVYCQVWLSKSQLFNSCYVQTFTVCLGQLLLSVIFVHIRFSLDILILIPHSH